jgi:hypothetical protein
MRRLPGATLLVALSLGACSSMQPKDFQAAWYFVPKEVAQSQQLIPTTSGSQASNPQSPTPQASPAQPKECEAEGDTPAYGPDDEVILFVAVLNQAERPITVTEMSLGNASTEVRMKRCTLRPGGVIIIPTAKFGLRGCAVPISVSLNPASPDPIRVPVIGGLPSATPRAWHKFCVP